MPRPMVSRYRRMGHIRELPRLAKPIRVMQYAQSYALSDVMCRRGGWYRWNREWFTKAVYTKVETGQVAFLMHDGGSEQIAILPDSWETTVNLEALAETVTIANDGSMQEMACY